MADGRTGAGASFGRAMQKKHASGAETSFFPFHLQQHILGNKNAYGRHILRQVVKTLFFDRGTPRPESGPHDIARADRGNREKREGRRKAGLFWPIPGAPGFIVRKRFHKKSKYISPMLNRSLKRSTVVSVSPQHVMCFEEVALAIASIKAASSEMMLQASFAQHNGMSGRREEKGRRRKEGLLERK